MTSKISDGIVIYSTKGDIMFSSTGEIISRKKAPRKHRIHKNITNQVFEDMRKYNDNEFWDSILVKFSRNVFSNDFRFILNTLYYKIKSKNHKDEITIDTEDLEGSFEKLKDFLRLKGILPVEEIVDDSEELIGEREKIVNWKDVGKNRINFIYQFIQDMSEKYDLEDNEKKHLESLLKISIYNNIIGNEHIHLEDEKIKTIDHLEWIPEKRIFKINVDEIKIKSLKQEKKVEDKYYIISSFSDEKNVIFNKEVAYESMEKKWDDFLISYYNP